MKEFNLLIVLCSSLFLVQCNSSDAAGGAYEEEIAVVEKLVSKPMHKKLIDAARSQIGKTVSYDPAYVSLQFPNGDIPIARGVCTDVVIRAMRKAWNYDLQKQVNIDMKANFSKYPKIWGLSKPDRNIDHRRVPNLAVFMKRKGWEVPATQNAEDYKPGDIVVTKVGGKRPHISIVSDVEAEKGRSNIIHNIGSGTRENDGLFDHKIVGHYRIPDGTFK